MNKKLLYLILIPMIISCSNMMNPMYLYYNKRAKSSYNNNTNDIIIPDAVDADKDPFIQGEHNDINYGGFDGKIFDTWLFKVSFKGNKLPIYNFFSPNGGRNWLANGQDWKGNSATYYNGDKSENIVYDAPVVGNQGIENLKIYKYDKNNPLYDSKGYLTGRMDRFKFYSIDGKAVIELKQYLIAVDTYSKFVFAYGAITAIGNTLGNKYPTDFEAIEFHAKKIHFYEYDPIGYVTKDGEVVLYNHYQTEFVSDPTGYTPKQHGYTAVASHNPQGQGYSPYRPITDNVEAPDDEKEEFKNKINSLKDKELKWRDYSGYTSSKDQIDLDAWKNAKHSGKSLELHTYTLTDNSIKIVKTKYGTEQKTEEVYTLKTITSKTTAIYENANKTKLNLDINKDNAIIVNAVEIGTEDYGPIFVDRVRGAKFQNGGNTYTFNEDGTGFTLEYKKTFGGTATYKYTLGRFDNKLSINYSAIYKASPGGTFGDYGRVVLRNNDDLIKTSTVLGQIGALGTATSDAGLGYNANRVK